MKTTIITIVSATLVMLTSGNIFGVNYDPAHHDRFPVYHNGDTSQLYKILEDDFRHMKAQGFTVVKTFFSRYYNQDVADIANLDGIGMQLYLGVFLTDDVWGREQIEAAKRAMDRYPHLIKAIVVGNEDVDVRSNADQHKKKFPVQRFVDVINELKHHRGGRNIPIGTSQRINEWLFSADEMWPLTAACDYIGVTIYPYFSNGFDPHNPLHLLQLQWEQMWNKYPHTGKRMVLMETGFPTAGTAPGHLHPPAHYVPTIEKARNYYYALKYGWNQADRFVFMMYDRHPRDPVLPSEWSIERYFGLFDKDRGQKWAMH